MIVNTNLAALPSHVEPCLLICRARGVTLCARRNNHSLAADDDLSGVNSGYGFVIRPPAVTFV